MTTELRFLRILWKWLDREMIRSQKRVVVSLLLDGRSLVKGNLFKRHSYVGDPLNMLRIFSDKKVDELCLLQINPNKALDLPFLKSLAEEARMPIAYGGGLEVIDDALRVIDLGFEKLVLHSALHRDLAFSDNLASKIGAQSVVASVNVRTVKNTFWSCWGRKPRKDLLNYFKELNSSGCGEILINNIDLEGTNKGPNLNLANISSSWLSKPVLYGGGVGSHQHVKSLLDIPSLSGVVVGNMSIYHGNRRAVLPSYFYD